MRQAQLLPNLCRGLMSLAALALLAFPAGAQPIAGPSLGFVLEGAAGRVRPLSGIASAASVGRPIQLPIDASSAVVSPGGDYVMIIAAMTGAAGVWQPRTGSLQWLSAVTPGASAAMLSPSGSAAALYFPASSRVQVVTGLPGTPSVPRDFFLTALRNPLKNLAVSDDGSLLLCSEDVTTDGELAPPVVVIGPTGDLNRIQLSGAATAIAFASNSHDALLVSDGEVIVLRNSGAFGTPIALPSSGVAGATSVAFSADGQHAYFVRRGAATIAVYDFAAGGPATILTCECRLEGLSRIGGAGAYRLTEYSGAPLRILDGTATPPRIVIAPPALDSDRQP
jgi:hypothetical protein